MAQTTFARAGTTPKKRKPKLIASFNAPASQKPRPTQQASFQPTTAATAPTGTTPVSGNPAPTAAPDPQYDKNSPPPATVAGQQMRINADSAYNTALASGNKGLFDAAMRYGSRDLLQRPEFALYLNGEDPTRLDMSGSALGRIDKQLGDNLQGVDQSRNAAGAFFSGFRTQDRREQETAAAQDRNQAFSDYEAAATTLYNALAQAGVDKNTAYETAFGTDLDAAMALDPQPTVPQGGPAHGGGPANLGPGGLQGIGAHHQPGRQFDIHGRPLNPPQATGSSEQKTIKKKPKHRKNK